MSRWTTYLWRGLAAVAESGCPLSYAYLVQRDQTLRTQAPQIHLGDDASVDATFCSIVEREWGATSFRGDTPHL